MEKNTSPVGSFAPVVPAARILAAAALCVCLAAPDAANAQLIPVRVVPVAEADQFGFFPSANFGMAGVSIALPDTLLDAHHNPALAARIRRAVYYGAPTFFSVTNDAGSGQTFPIGGMVRLGRTFLGGSLATQEIAPARSRQEQFFGPIALTSSSSFAPGPLFEPERAEPQRNQYVHGTLGHTFPSRLSVAVSGLWSNLNAMEGMDLRFMGSHRVRQEGRRSDVRVGVLKEWGARSLEAVAVRSRTSMQYDVGYAQLYWDPASRQQRVQTHDLQSDGSARVSALNVRYDMPFIDSTWRAGAIATVNDIRESKSPYYEFMAIPLDPSRTIAYNLGVGVSRRIAPMTVAFDVVLEPMWRRATGVVDTSSLASFAPGTNVEDSWFRFHNVVLRGGIARDLLITDSDNRLRLQFGTQVRAVNYTLEQHDRLNSVYRERSNSWREWTHSWGAVFVFPRFEFGYHLRMLSGMGRLGVPPENNDVVFGVPDFGGGPNPLSATLYPVRVASHQMFFTVPLR